MGKKNRKSRSATADAESGMSRAVVKDTMEIVNVLLEKCSNPFDTKGRDWEAYLEIYGLVEKLRKKQAAYVMPHPDRAAGFPAFLTWLQQYGVDTEAIAIEKFDIGGYGLKATRDIKESELLLSIPHKLMLTTISAKASLLGPLIKGDRMLQSMPSVALSLHVLCERANPNSFWAPYLNILPDTYSLPLYFTADEMELLKGSPAFSEAINQFRNISRQYAYFFKQFQAIDDVLKLPVRNMCFDDYRWAVSTVMTRQNQIPNRRGDQTITSLIPLWDMCNHDNGHITTDYDLKKDCTQCYSLRDFKTGDQIYIFYGERSNADLLVHNGFIFPNSHYDKLNIKLGISKNDHLFAMKSEVLARLSLVPSRVFGLMAGPDPVDSNMVAYLRVFCMDSAALDARLRGENAPKLLRQLRDFGLLVSVENEKKCWNFLETRVQLLLRTYPTTRKQDEELLAQADNKLSYHARMVIQLRAAEKQILETTAEFARLQRDEVDELVRQHLEELSLGVNDLKDAPNPAEEDDDDDLRGLGMKPSSDWDSIQKGVVIEEIEDVEMPPEQPAAQPVAQNGTAPVNVPKEEESKGVTNNSQEAQQTGTIKEPPKSSAPTTQSSAPIAAKQEPTSQPADPARSLNEQSATSSQQPKVNGVPEQNQPPKEETVPVVPKSIDSVPDAVQAAIQNPNEIKTVDNSPAPTPQQAQ